MKILMISIFAPHFINWTEQLKDSGHEIYWLDVFDSGTHVEKLDFVHQIIGWRYRWDFPGRYLVKSKSPRIIKAINKFNERNLVNVLERKIKEIQPDVVHSFVMYLSTAPIRQVMMSFSEIKWIYSSWGSDLYYYRKQEKPLLDMQRTLPEIDFMFADCQRDHSIAVENGFSGKFLGVFPGGGGINFKETDPLMKPISERNLILVKGYQGLHGRCITVLVALIGMKEQLKKYKIIVFGATREVEEFVGKMDLGGLDLHIFEKIPHSQVMELMGLARIYIGNSRSDGVPNTLLESIVMGAFPIQSNPGGATAELIEHRKNGLILEYPDDIDSIRATIQILLVGEIDLVAGVEYNLKVIKPNLERQKIKNEVLSQYDYIEQRIGKQTVE